jgi:hypothetical protein
MKMASSGLKRRVDWRKCSKGLRIVLMMEAVHTSETSVQFYQSTRCFNPEDSRLHLNFAEEE